MKPSPENSYSKSDYHTPLQVATELGLDQIKILIEQEIQKNKDKGK